MSSGATGLRIGVLVKQVPDPGKISVDPHTRRAIIGGSPVVNTFDAYAIAEAIDLKERYGADVTIVSAGPASARDAIMRGLGTGADRGIHLLANDLDQRDSLALAKLLADSIRELKFDIVLAGQTSEDLETSQVGPQVAELLDLPHVSLVTSLEVEGRELKIRRDSEGRKQQIAVAMPAMLLILTGRDGEQRHPSLKGMMQAKRKPIDVIEVPPVGDAPRMTWSEPEAPVRVRAATILQGVPPQEAAKQLVAWFRDKHLA
ncbi:MAG: electron transfer flavoprotein subunit beta/FixA family protein [Thermomicrobiales bacterium]